MTVDTNYHSNIRANVPNEQNSSHKNIVLSFVRMFLLFYCPILISFLPPTSPQASPSYAFQQPSSSNLQQVGHTNCRSGMIFC